MGKKKKSGKVRSKRKSKIETTKHSLGILYYIIMIVFALSLFITLTLVWMKLGPILESISEITNSTESSLEIIFKYSIKIIKLSRG